MAPPSTFDANLLEGYIDQLRRGEVLPESVVRSLCEKVCRVVGALSVCWGRWCWVGGRSLGGWDGMGWQAASSRGTCCRA